MARGTRKDPREIFHIDRLRFLDRSKNPEAAPEKNTCEIFLKNKLFYKMCDNGVVTPIGGLGASASPGFTWGRKGNVSSANAAYLLNDEVPSNVTGRVVVFERPSIRKVLVTTSTVATCTFTIQEHDGLGNFTDLLAISLASQRATTQDYSVSVTSGKQLAIKVTSGSCSNPVVGVILDGLL